MEVQWHVRGHDISTHTLFHIGQVSDFAFLRRNAAFPLPKIKWDMSCTFVETSRVLAHPSAIWPGEGESGEGL